MADQNHQSQEPRVLVRKYSAINLNHRLYLGQFATYNGEFIWKIPLIIFLTAIRKGAQGCKAIWSPYFFTSPRGIKMCLKMYPIGPRMGIATHMSLYFVILPGHYDRAQNWPFNQRVTLSILNQNGGANITKTITPDPTGATFQRPTTNIHIGTGYERYIELAQLMDPNNGFLKDNAIFIKAEVDTQGLREPFADVTVGNIARETVAVQCSD